GIKLKEEVKFYDPGNLYEYINGQAVFYLSYKFIKLEHGFYERDGATFYVDVYELGSQLSALGAYRQQKEQDAADLGIGCEGAIVEYLTVLHKGKFYVEIIPMDSGDDDEKAMRLIAGHVAKLIPGSEELPPEVGLFPKDGIIDGSERYVDESLISYSFMGRGLSARYESGIEKKLRLFIAMTDDESKAKEIFESYKKKLENSSPVKIGSKGGFKGKEPYRGITIISSWKNFVFGCLDVEDEPKAIDLLTKAQININKFGQ
ncbi:MAG: hypothetical protein HOC71_05235, partial [Candidatus Latescibacteria bacterium]|nr:hypothetical protein [Candidatus Latescibacterota bacterium]